MLAPPPKHRDVANRLHYFEAEELLSGPALLQEYDGACLSVVRENKGCLQVG